MLRPYQLLALDRIATHFENVSKRCILRMPTGSGKTSVVAEIIRNWEGPTLTVIKSRKLIWQMSERFSQEQIDHDIIMAGVKNPRSTSSKNTVASIDTLYARKIVPRATLICIDEVHLARTDSFDWLFKHYPHAYYLGVSATPYSKRGFKEIADAIIEVVQVPELIKAGYLVPGKYYAPEIVDLSTVKKCKDDYNLTDLSNTMNQARLRGPVVGSWRRLGENRPTLCFCVSVQHSKSMVAEFKSAGINAEHIDATSSTEQRNNVLQRLLSGELKVVCSVSILITGVDLPPVSCLIVCRPTTSYCVHAQLLGRGTRPYPGKNSVIVLDHSNNLIKFGFYEEYRVATLDGKPPAYRVVLNRCEKCYFIWTPTGDPACPGRYPDGSVCGHVKPVVVTPPRKIKTDTTVDLVELTPEELERRTRETWIDDTIRRCAEAGYKQGAAFYQIKSRYGATVANACWGRIRAGFRVEDN